MGIRSKITVIVAKAVPKGTAFDVRVAEEHQEAHYATTVAFQLAKTEKKNPREIAARIASDIGAKAPRGFFEKVEVAGPGFINFFLSNETLGKELKQILGEKRKYGTLKLLKKKIQLEFISANPTGPLTLANGRGGFLGDVLGNVLQRAGAKVEREYYVNDTGNQVLNLGKSILAARGIIPDSEEYYKGDYVKEWADKHSALIETMKEKPLALGERAAKDFLGLIKIAVEKKAKIEFNRFTSEKRIHTTGLVKKVLALFKKKGFSFEGEGAMWLKTTAFGDDKDRVIVTKEGNPTYFLADAGHYLETKQRGFDTKINILGPDHYGYVARIQAVAKILGFKESTVLVTQAIRLMEQGELVKMSKRKGKFVTFEELVDEVGADVARFFFLMIAPETHMDFDLTLAKERSQKNPVYYVQYAYVRAKNILTKMKIKTIPKSFNVTKLSTAQDINLIRELARFPEIIEDAARDYGVHRLTRYALNLAKAFHNFYEVERVAGEEKTIKDARTALVIATCIVFENLFSIIGITAPKKM